MFLLLCFLAAILGTQSASAPFIKPCVASDNACILSSAQAAVPVVAPGVPELGIDSLDPLHLKLIKGDQGGLRLTFKDTIVTGMRGCSVDGIKNDLVKGKQSITIRCTVTLDGNYKLSGNLLVLPVQGEGPYQIRIRDIIIKAYTDIKTVDGEDGKPHWTISDWRHTYRVKTSTVFKFDNLFNGNKALAGPVEQFINSEWREVMREVASPIVRAIVAAVVDGVKALYKAVPAEELFVSE